jgi:hypothetical protein
LREAPHTDARLHLLLRERAQAESLPPGLPVASVTLDFEIGRDYKPSLSRL